MHDIEPIQFSRRAFAVLARCNQLIVSDLPAEQLLERFCSLAVHDAGFVMAWVGFALHDDAKTVKPMAATGFEEGYLSKVPISWGDGPHGLGPTGRAIRERRPVVFSRLGDAQHFAPWRAEALQRGYASSVALPLLDGDRVFGALNLYAAEEHAFETELPLLQEVATDLAFGLRSAERRVALARAAAATNRVEHLSASVRAGAGVIHDLNNLLTVIRSSVDVMRLTLGADARLEPELHSIDEAVERSARLARSALRFARPPDEAIATLAVDVTLGRLWPVLERLLERHHVSRLELGGQQATVRLARSRFEQLVLNLVTNARDAMSAGGALTVRSSIEEVAEVRPLTVGVLHAGTWARLSVTDTGTGMTAHVQSRIFEAFFTTKQDKGTGLGLATVFSIVNEAGGAIDVVSTVGKGSTFDVYLPLA